MKAVAGAGLSLMVLLVLALTLSGSYLEWLSVVVVVALLALVALVIRTAMRGLRSGANQDPGPVDEPKLATASDYFVTPYY